MKNPFKKDTIGINVHAGGLDKEKIGVLFPWLLKILNTSAGDALKIAAIEAVKTAAKGEISNMNISNVHIDQTK